MKKRNIPFGYQYESGMVTVNPAEKKSVQRIFTEYLGGASLLTVANGLNRDGVEYTPGVTGWNKSRLARIIEDKRYVGDDIFPAIISQEEYDQAQTLKAGKDLKRNIDSTAGVYQISAPVICSACGKPMQRRHDSRTTFGEKWSCACGSVIKIDDNSLLQAITDTMNAVIRQPDFIKPTAVKAEIPLEVRKAENNVKRLLGTYGTPKESIKKSIYDCAALKFRHIPTADCTPKLKADFEKSNPLSVFYRELFDRTTSAVRLYADQSVGLILKNGQEIRKEHIHADSSITENPSGN